MVKVYGTNASYEALSTGRGKKVYLLKGYSNQKILNEIKKNKLEIIYLGRKELDDLSDGANHQGIVLLASQIKPLTLDELIRRLNNELKCLVILDEIKDPHNLGAILRSCDAFNAGGIIYKSNNSVKINSTVEKVSTGAINYVPVCEVTNLNMAIDFLKKHDYWIVGLAGESSMSIEDLPYDRKLAFVLGSEGEGITRLVRKNCDYLAKIEMHSHGKIDSINVSNACSIILYEYFKRIKRT